MYIYICVWGSVPPALSVFSFRSDLAAGDRVSVQCSVNRGDAPLQLTWTKDGVPAANVRGEHRINVDHVRTWSRLLYTGVSNELTWTM